MPGDEHHARPAEARLAPLHGAGLPLHAHRERIAGIPPARAIEVPTVHDRRCPVGHERRSRPGSAIAADQPRIAAGEVEEHTARPITLGEEYFVARDDRARGNGTEEFIGPPAKFREHRSRCRIDHEQIVAHPGQDSGPAADLGKHRRRVARQLARAAPPLAAGGEIERHEPAVEPFHEIEPLRRRRRHARRAAPDLHHDEVITPHPHHERRRADAEKVLHDVVVGRGVDAPQARTVGERSALEPALGAKREHAVAVDHRRSPRPAVVAERVAVVARVCGVPERRAGLGLEAPRAHAIVNTIEHDDPAPRDCRGAVALAERHVPRHPGPSGWPGRRDPRATAAAVSGRPEKRPPVFARPRGKIGQVGRWDPDAGSDHRDREHRPYTPHDHSLHGWLFHPRLHPMPQEKEVRVGRVVIPAAGLEWQFVRSSGPGGQHVNRTSSKAVLRFDARHSPYLPEDVRSRLLEHERPRLTREGALLITSQKHRDQPRNIADCLAKLSAIVARALVAPKKRRPTKTPRSVVKKRLAGKRHRSETKRLRGRIGD